MSGDESDAGWLCTADAARKTRVKRKNFFMRWICDEEKTAVKPLNGVVAVTTWRSQWVVRNDRGVQQLRRLMGGVCNYVWERDDESEAETDDDVPTGWTKEAYDERCAQEEGCKFSS